MWSGSNDNGEDGNSAWVLDLSTVLRVLRSSDPLATSAPSTDGWNIRESQLRVSTREPWPSLRFPLLRA